MSVISDYLIRYFPEVSPLNYYRTIFPSGVLDSSHENPSDYVRGKYTGIVIEKVSELLDSPAPGGAVRREKVKRHTVTDDLDKIDELVGLSPGFCFMSPISYAGKARTSTNARFLHAITIEIDSLQHGEKPEEQGGLLFLLLNMHGGIYKNDKARLFPRPTFISASGTGIHVTYVLDRPLTLFRNNVESLTNWKNMMTTRLWRKDITEDWQKSKIQYEPIWQGFRIVGTLTKKGIEIYNRTGKRDANEVCRAFLVGGPVTVEYLNEWAKEEKNKIVPQYSAYRSGTQKKQNGNKDKKESKPWAVNRAVYDAWKKRLLEEVEEGGKRYYCLMTLVIYAVKCGYYDEKKNPNPVTKEELLQDCLELKDAFNEIHYVRKDGTLDPFTMHDVLAALDVYDEAYRTYPINSIAFRSGLEIKKNKRNNIEPKPGMTRQETHLEWARGFRTLNWNLRGIGYENVGRKKKEEIVRAWRAEHLSGTKAACIRETGLSKSTVYKWWDWAEVIEDPEERKITPQFKAHLENLLQDENEEKLDAFAKFIEALNKEMED